MLLPGASSRIFESLTANWIQHNILLILLPMWVFKSLESFAVVNFRETSHLLVHSLNSLNSQDWAGVELGVESRSVDGRNPVI